MSLEGQVLCQRMLIAPWALTTLGAATAAAAPAAVTFRKRRRVEDSSLVVSVMGVLPLWPAIGLPAFLIGANSTGLARAVARDTICHCGILAGWLWATTQCCTA